MSETYLNCKLINVIGQLKKLNTLCVGCRINEAWFCMNACSLFSEQGQWHHHTNLVPYLDLCLLVKKYKVWQQAEVALTTELIYTCKHQMNARLLSLLINKIYTWQILLLFSFFGRTSFSISSLNIFCPFHTNNSSSVQLNCTMVDLIPFKTTHLARTHSIFVPCAQIPFSGGWQREEIHLYIKDILMGHNRGPYPDMRAKMHFEYLQYIHILCITCSVFKSICIWLTAPNFRLTNGHVWTTQLQWTCTNRVTHAEQSWKGEDEHEWEYLDKEASEVKKSRGELYEHHLDWQVIQVPALLYTLSKGI